MLNRLSTNDFDRFLEVLDRDREEAAGKYLALRDRLEKFFEWRDCENTEELTDIVFDRVAKKIIGGEEIKNAEAYSVSVAKFVLLEHRREIFRSRELDENSPEISSREEPVGDDRDEEDRQLRCLNECLAKFPAEKRRLIISYFDTDERTLISTRQKLADKMGVNLNSLRIRISRLKSNLEKCTRECWQRS